MENNLNKILTGIALVVAMKSASAEMVLLVKPMDYGGVTLDMYVDSDRTKYDHPNFSVELGIVTNIGEAPPTQSQRFTLVLNCETGSQHMTKRIFFIGPMGTGRGQEIPDTTESSLKYYASPKSAKGILQKGMCKNLFRQIAEDIAEEVVRKSKN